MGNPIQSVAKIATIGLAAYAGWNIYAMWGAAIGGVTAVIATWR